MSETSNQSTQRDIRQDPGIQRLLERMPDSVQQSFDDEQLMHIRNAIGARNWGNHSLDWRGVFKIPMFKWRFYYVFLIGRNRRQLSGKEQRVALMIGAVFLTGMTTIGILTVLLALYLLKSAAGIDLFPGFSLGIWGWFKTNIL